MRVLVTGGAGYVGATAVRSLRAEGHEVVVYDNLSKGHREAVPSDVVLLTGDIAERSKLDAALREHRPEAVLHFAASIEAGESMRTPEKYFRNNSAGTLTLLEAMMANGVGKLIFSSTAALYGEPRHIPIVETDPLEPTNAYGESKLVGNGCCYGLGVYTASGMRVCGTSMPQDQTATRESAINRSLTWSRLYCKQQPENASPSPSMALTIPRPTAPASGTIST